MKKNILFFLSAGLLVVLAACSSPEEDEVLDYHNDYVDFVNPKMDELEELVGQIEMAETDEEAYEVEKEEALPLIEDIKSYLDDQDPEEDVTIEYHELRSNWADNYYEGVETETEGYEALVEGSEEEAVDLFEESEEQVMEANEYDDKADEKWEDIMDEYNFEEEENDE